MKHVTLGRLERYIDRAIQVRGKVAFDEWWDSARLLPRRALLKALRDFMSPKRDRKIGRDWWAEKSPSDILSDIERAFYYLGSLDPTPVEVSP